MSLSILFGCDDSNNKSSKKNPEGERTPTTPGNPPAPTPEPPPQTSLKDCQTYCASLNVFEKYQKPHMSHLSFTNFGYRGVGRCRGHALLNQRLSTLVEFQPRGGCDISTPTCIDSLKQKVQIALRDEAVVIRGFKNLFEFSSVPEMHRYLRSIVAGTSNRYRATLGYIENPNYDTLQESVFYELQRRVNLGQLPYVGLEGNLTGSHAVIAYAEEFKNNMHVICTRDPNYLYGGKEQCDNYFYVNKNSEVFYKRKNKLPDFMFSMKVYSDDDERMESFESALTSKCLVQSRAQNLCK